MFEESNKKGHRPLPCSLAGTARGTGAGDTWPIEVRVVHGPSRTVLPPAPWKARRPRDVAPAELTFLVVPPVFIASPSEDRREGRTHALQNRQLLRKQACWRHAPWLFRCSSNTGSFQMIPVVRETCRGISKHRPPISYPLTRFCA